MDLFIEPYPPMRIIKRYSNRKLYDTEKSVYVTLDEISEMVRVGQEIQVVDNKTQKDLTNITLAQIIFEEEKRSKRFLPLPALRSIIQGGGDLIQKLSLPVQQFKVETQDAVDHFLRAGERLDEGRNAIREFSLNFQKTLDDMQHKIDERVRDAVDTLTHVPRLTDRVQKIENQLEALSESLDNMRTSISEIVRHKEDL
jgi:polyhydroxyalkanoate synthesis repressor PhaR